MVGECIFSLVNTYLKVEFGLNKEGIKCVNWDDFEIYTMLDLQPRFGTVFNQMEEGESSCYVVSAA